MEKTKEKVLIRIYNDSDKDFLVRACDGIQEHVSRLDPTGRIVVGEGYGEFFTNGLLKLVVKNEGIILIAEVEGKPVGTGLAFIREQKPENLLKHIPEKVAEIRNLYVDPEFRSAGIGSSLLAELEDYLKIKGCDAVLLYVFEPNNKAHKLYEELGYVDRSIEMQKEL